VKLKHLPTRVKFNYEYSTQKAIEAGVSNNTKGLTQVKDITKVLKELL